MLSSKEIMKTENKNYMCFLFNVKLILSLSDPPTGFTAHSTKCSRRVCSRNVCRHRDKSFRPKHLTDVLEFRTLQVE